MPEFTGGPAFDDDRDEEAEDFGESPFSSEELFDAPAAIPEPVAPMPRSFVPAVIRLLPLSAEELEHADDTKLDDAYEEKLTFAGDNLKPLASASAIIRELLGDFESLQRPIQTNGNGNGNRNGLAARSSEATTFNIDEFRAAIEKADEPVELPELGPEPTEDELAAYAKAHPTVRSALRVFRGKLVSVKLRG
jgi:hypothetical protein